MDKIVEILEKTYPDAHIALDFKTPFQLLVSVILSAQCTDVRVNLVTPRLFERFPDAKNMAEAPVEELEDLVRSTGFFRNKAKNIKAASRMITDQFGGELPCTMKEMLKLPGVARKTANIVLTQAFGVVEGIAVDTHVKRLSSRLGFSTEKTPEKIEKDLMELIPFEKWGKISYILIEHGRKVCNARRPMCGECRVREYCPSADESLG